MVDKKKYYSIQVYVNKKDHRKFQELLGGIPVSVWFRQKEEEVIKNDKPINI